MSFFDILILGMVQGTTEFLPISSSGHLILIRSLLDMEKIYIFFDFILHLGTLIPVFTVLRKEISLLFKFLNNFSIIFNRYKSFKLFYSRNIFFHLIVILIISLFSTGIIGFLLKNVVSMFFDSLKLISAAFMMTGLVLLLSITIKKKIKNDKKFRIKIKDSIMIGAFQGITVIPGLSRSGVTIISGIILGYNKKISFYYSFILSIFTILSLLTFNLSSFYIYDILNIKFLFFGIFVSIIISFFSLKFLLFLNRFGKFYILTPYCFALGFFLLFFY